MPQTPEAELFLSRIAQLPSGPGVFDALSDALQPSLDDEATLRKLFAMEKTNTRLQDPHVGLVDVFDASADIKTTRARVVADETDLYAKFVMPLSNTRRRKDGAPAMVPTLDEFKQSWAIFTEGSLSQLIDWNNVIAAGGSVQACLNPLPDSAKVSKRALRKYFHSNAYPTSDIDLFLYGLTTEQAEVKINTIYEAVRDSVPWDVTCVRTKHTVSVHSQYPYRAVQIVLRLYTSPAEILAGFDVDAPCCAYDGQRVWVNPRAIVAMMRQCNTVDMTRRSPSYEVRLAKYSMRDFEVYVPSLRRDDIDPTMFERSIARMQGLARLLVLERLTDADTRNKYLISRRTLRGRPQTQAVHYRRQKKMYKGDLKADMDFGGLEMNDYDVVSLHIPYGPGWDARRIEKLIYQTDLSMNSPFNPKNKDRHLHRHPAFFGTMEECLKDCCEYCPQSKGEEERKLQEEEDKTYTRGRIEFIQEDPGRQSISGSFNPIDVGEWGEQAYMGPIEKLFNAIVSQDKALVSSLIQEDGTDIDRRDYVGRTPLQIAIMSKAVDIACDLIDAGARMTARLVDGRTALHLAAQLNLPEVVRKLLDRSEVNAEKAKEAEEEVKRKEKEEQDDHKMDVDDESDKGSDEENSSEDDWGSDDNDDDKKSSKEADAKPVVDENAIVDDEDELDIFDVNATDWDLVFTPLQYAIVFGSTAVVDQLIAAGADVQLATKSNGYDSHHLHQLTVATLTENREAACEIVKKLFAAGAVSSQADDNLFTIFHQIVCSGQHDLVHTVLRCDPNAKIVVNTPQVGQWNYVVYPLVSAITQRAYSMLAILLAYGAKVIITEEDYSRALDMKKNTNNRMNDTKNYLQFTPMPLETAIACRDDVVGLLLALGADVNLPTREASRYMTASWQANDRLTLLDWVSYAAKAAEGELRKLEQPKKPKTASDPLSEYRALAAIPGWKGEVGKVLLKSNEDQKAFVQVPGDTQSQKQHLSAAKEYFNMVKTLLSPHGAETWNELYPDNKAGDQVKDYFKIHSPSSLNAIFSSSKVGYQRFVNQYARNPVPAHLVAQYDELFEACWTGDNAKIQELCLPKPGRKAQEIPLQITVQYGEVLGVCNPLSLAINGRHWDTAPLILAIASAQYHPEQPKEEKFQTRNIVLGNDDDEGDSDEDEDDDMVADESTNFIDIAKRPSAVQVLATPAHLLNNMISWIRKDGQHMTGSLLQQAVLEDDFEAFVKIADMFNSQPKPVPIPAVALLWILEYDCPSMLDELIRRTGLGIDVDTESESEDGAPVSKQKSSKVYLGLNVHGKKRKDLATKNDPNATPRVETATVPMLWIAAKHDSLNVVHYLASGRPLAAYQYYASTHSDERAHFLRRVPDLAAVLPQWIGWTTNAMNESAITAAVIGNKLESMKTMLALNPTQMRHALSLKLNYVCFNHILVAANWGASPEVFGYLLEKGISPLEVDHRGWNILHMLCVRGNENHFKLLKHVLQKLPEDTVAKLLLQQSKGAQNTPLHLVVTRRRVDLLRLFLRFKTLPYLVRNTAGSTALHIAIRQGSARITQLLLDGAPPELLYMEDGVGSTPLETVIQRDLIRLTCLGFPCRLPNSQQLGSNLREYTGSKMLDLSQQKVEILRLRATVEELLKEGRLRAGTKMATELLAFTERMEEKLRKEKALAETEEVPEATKQPKPEFKVDWDNDDAAKTRKCVEKAVSARAAARSRVLVHLSDVHKSVRGSLEWSTRKFEVAKQDGDGLEGEVVVSAEEKAKQNSVIKRWAFGNLMSPFEDDGI